MGPSQPIVNHLHALWLEQQARKGIVFLRGQLTPEEDAAIRSVISQGEERTIANMLSVTLSTNSLVNLEATTGRICTASTYVLLSYGPAMQYSSCNTTVCGDETFLIESALAFQSGDGEPMFCVPDHYWIGITAEQFEKLLVQGQEIGERLLPLYQPVAEEVCATRGYLYRDPERYIWVSLQVDIPLTVYGELDLESVRVRIDSNQYCHLSTAPISLVGELDISSIVRTIFAEG